LLDAVRLRPDTYTTVSEIEPRLPYSRLPTQSSEDKGRHRSPEVTAT
jgi:hypothetical protein